MIEVYVPCVSCGKYVDDGGFTEGRITCHKCLDERGEKNREFLRLIEEHFAISSDKNSLVLDSWTDAGINITIQLNKDNKSMFEEFEKAVNDFNPSDHIKGMRSIGDYKENFFIEDSFNDLESHKQWLNDVLKNTEKKGD